MREKGGRREGELEEKRAVMEFKERFCCAAKGDEVGAHGESRGREGGEGERWVRWDASGDEG